MNRPGQSLGLDISRREREMVQEAKKEEVSELLTGPFADKFADTVTKCIDSLIGIDDEIKRQSSEIDADKFKKAQSEMSKAVFGLFKARGLLRKIK